MGLTNYTFGSRTLPGEDDPEVMDQTQIYIGYSDGQVLRWNKPGYLKAINMPPRYKPILLRVRGFFALFEIPIDSTNTPTGDPWDNGTDNHSDDQLASPPTPSGSKRAGPYLFWNKDAKRLHHLAAKTNIVTTGGTYYFAC